MPKSPSSLPIEIKISTVVAISAILHSADPIAIVLLGTDHRPTVVVTHDTGSGFSYTLVERVAEWVSRTYPDADPDPVGAETCIYTTTADEGFILERRGRIVIGSPCSGHGFKFAPAIGNRLAQMAADIL